jgi:CTP:phosphocholine cytidylyltransferase-like protein
MPRVERAIITAAGFGSRMNPVTLDTPKPLVPVNGKPMIETTIDALRKQGICEIYVIVGYLKEKFEYLTEKYPGLELIENPDYKTANSISSLYAARAHLANSIVLDGDQIIYNDSVFAPEFERSGYNASYKEDGVPEWLAEIDEKGIIQKVTIEGAEKGWAISGICRWTEEDAKKLARHLEIEFKEKNNRDIYWDAVALWIYPHEYELGIFVQEKLSDVVEVDSLEELAEIDPYYKKYIS